MPEHVNHYYEVVPVQNGPNLASGDLQAVYRDLGSFHPTMYGTSTPVSNSQVDGGNPLQSTPSSTYPRTGVDNTFAHPPGLDAYNRNAMTRSPTHPCRWMNCNRMFKRISELRRHVNAIHISPESFPCALCGHRCNRKDTLKQHMLQSHHSTRTANRAIEY
ncbi:hypothetical protein BO94DRAFT_539994 [Aspergillus sclerotioniger CBS 115572]|uniref:C2H2-type domain-containing protein n=1 Tax=Aspergillus sclerotioniger CBS 115572 TaxID=1450535 RepID=A0A317V5U5_9EURO|nr:hypothetical protein BO94DRAFT_539994 [Aspergillus sclerotioniger CBS 115572]PWY69663.1 hypothetical protein BO94DRAFT_539994 [Aspergillus sclerotioniger CBS 115572]